MPDTRTLKLTGLLLVFTPLAYTLFFSLLQATFSYPRILRQSPDTILRRFSDGGTGLVALWYVFALTAMLLVPISVLLGRVLTGGAIVGAVLGAGQWLALRRRLHISGTWIAATALGFALGAGIGGALTHYGTSAGTLALGGAILGAAVGGMQALILRRHIPGALAGWWAGASALLWALGWTITRAIAVDVSRHWIIFGSSGAVVVTILGGMFLSALLQAGVPVPFVIPATDIESVAVQQGGVR